MFLLAIEAIEHDERGWTLYSPGVGEARWSDGYCRDFEPETWQYRVEEALWAMTDVFGTVIRKWVTAELGHDDTDPVALERLAKGLRADFFAYRVRLEAALSEVNDG